ncbi:zinc-binding dehydrogenase [Gordonia terrae]|uniref:Zinc-binding dehydrogenase n=2 Tax=Gordonia terrae TaxID=2055 RepID=A0AAD0NUI5_9ACTN|nr:zinc-binding dehydrogenase [Gordonia terrae]VTR09551.1 2,3-butanediol dehydrogenase [Clostridioides difficile]ANY22169.1 zinc-binding dehydrogenase [Gordonia terrae]AWO82911.1 zinc-binding dehydrogenase [Gordonia terrae]VTS28945.1 L-threonine 3-dehydrogenase [Gordonia terrae]GAB46371.1 putative oxidoreductase [Gordonia terrae NBRC 100016]
MTSTMKAGRVDFGTHEFAIREVPVPLPGPGEVRVKVAAAGVCLSDVHLISGMVAPLRDAEAIRTLGHEVAGTVDALGPQTRGWAEGDRVTLQAVIARPWGVDTMGVDYDGGWAEYVVVPQQVLVGIPDSLPFDQACIIPDAVSTPWAAVSHTAKVQAGESAAVWGVGGLGVHAIQLLKMIGAAPIIAIDPLPAARDKALTRGADAALDPTESGFPEQMTRATRGRGVDVAFDFAGFPGIDEQALALLNPGGRLVITGISGQPIRIDNSVALIAHHQQVLGHYGYLPPHVEQLVRLIEWQRLDLSASISAHIPLDSAAEAVRQLECKEGDPIRLVLIP